MSFRPLSVAVGAIMALSTAAALAAGPVPLTSAEMDRVSAGGYCDFCFGKKVVGTASLTVASKIVGKKVLTYVDSHADLRVYVTR